MGTVPPTNPLHDDAAARRDESRLANLPIRGAQAPKQASDQLIVALDFPDARSALDLVDRLEGATQWFKVGLELYISAGNSLVAELRGRGCSVFLDLKLHDIPNTVGSAVRAVSKLDVQMLTLHAAGGADMLSAAAAAASETALALLAVTVLTSMNSAHLEAIGVPGSAAEQVDRLASLAISSNIEGLVCSPFEVESLRKRLGADPLLVIPGIRPAGSEVGDQVRVATPHLAIAAGASYLVVGRPITRAADPGSAARAVVAEIAAARGGVSNGGS